MVLQQQIQVMLYFLLQEEILGQLSFHNVSLNIHDMYHVIIINHIYFQYMAKDSLIGNYGEKSK